MKLRMMTAASVLALMLSASAHAAVTSANDVSGEAAVSSDANLPPKNGSMTTDIKRGLSKADAKMRDTADDIKAFFVGKKAGDKLTPVTIHRSSTAHGMLDQTIVNPSGNEVAEVKDIILDKSGHASLIVVSDGGFLGIGDKVAAFDYNKVVTQKANGDVVMALTQDMVDHAADFSYDQDDWAKAKVIPAGSVSVNDILKGDVLDNKGDKVASVENVYFRNKAASQIIVGFDKTLGMGGKLAALDYGDLQMVKKDRDINFRLTAAQTAQFKNFEKTASK